MLNVSATGARSLDEGLESYIDTQIEMHDTPGYPKTEYLGFWVEKIF